MRFAIHSPHHLFQLLFALVCITLGVVLMSECPSLGQSQAPVRVEGFQTEIPDLMRVRENLYLGGQPAAESLHRLRELGVKTIVNLRPHEESGARNESQEAADVGLKYFNIPVTPDTFTYEKVENFHRLLGDTANYPIFVHCRSGNRAAGMWFVYRVLFEQATTQEALTEAKALGLEDALESKLQEFLTQQQE